MEYGRLWAQRKLRGWSQEDLVRRLIDAGIELGERQLGVTRSQISRWERGVTHPRAPYPKLLCRVFELSAEELGLFEAPLFDEGRATLEAEDDVRRRDFLRLVGTTTLGAPLVLPVVSSPLSAMSGPSAQGEDDTNDQERLRYIMTHPSGTDERVIDDLERQTFGHEQRTGTLPPAYHLVTVRHHLSTLQALIRDIPARWSRDLLSMTSRAAILAAWLCGQMENWGDAKVYSQMAIGWAIEAGDSETHAQVLIHRSSLYSQVPHGNTDADSQLAIKLLNQAAEVTSSPMRLAWLFAWRAVENAAIGNADASDRDLDDAYRCLSQVPITVDIGLNFLRDWDQISLDAYRGNCAVSLGRTDEAITILEDVHLKSGPTLGSRRTAVLGDLAIAYARRAEVEQACMMASRYLGRALALRMPARVWRARRVRMHLDPWKGHSEVQRLDEQFKQAHDMLA